MLFEDNVPDTNSLEKEREREREREHVDDEYSYRELTYTSHTPRNGAQTVSDYWFSLDKLGSPMSNCNAIQYMQAEKGLIQTVSCN